MILSTYQAASGAGAAAMEELVESTRAYLDGRPFTPKVIPHPYAFNLFSHNTAIDPETGYNDEETKVIKETRKIFEDDKIAIGVTCVRVPVLRAHCEAITFECEKPITEAEVRAILANAPGVKIVDDRAKNYFPMPIDASGQDDVLVGRIRKDLSDASGHSISMFVVGRPAPEGRGAERDPDRGAAAAARRWREDRCRVGKERSEPTISCGVREMVGTRLRSSAHPTAADTATPPSRAR